MRRIKYPLALLCVCSLSLQAAAATCGYAALPIDPLSAARTDVYVGQGKQIEVSFANEATGQPVETFPESNLKIRRTANNVVCEINGGIWVRNSVYLSMNERTLIAKQFSGSNESLSFYDTQTCALKAEVDVSNRAWHIEPTGLRVGKRCASGQLQSCKATALHRWRADCVANVSQRAKGVKPITHQSRK